jgi:hypothetical protein
MKSIAVEVKIQQRAITPELESARVMIMIRIKQEKI